MEEYNKMIEEMLEKHLVNDFDYFDYSDSPNSGEFDAAFLFYKEALAGNVGFGIEPAYLFFRNVIVPNARAAYYNGNYIIAINAGTIIFLLGAFKSKDLFSVAELSGWREFEKELDSKIEKLMYENALHFTFYHEMAHLIQQSPLLEYGLNEQPISEEYSARRHMLELDADEYSAISIGAHGLQYARYTFGDNISANNVEKIFAIMCCSVLIYLLSFEGNRRDIYYKETTHPHPIIRMSYIIFVIMDYANQAIEQIGLDIKINPRNIMKQLIEMASPLSKEIFSEDLVAKYQGYLHLEAANINAYVAELQEAYKDDSSLAVSKWNVLANKLHNN